MPRLRTKFGERAFSHLLDVDDDDDETDRQTDRQTHTTHTDAGEFIICPMLYGTDNGTDNNNVAVENLGSFDFSSLEFLNDLGNKIRLSSDEDKETAFLFQRISVVIQ